MPVHPCGRREHTPITLTIWLEDGSSLRAQGTRIDAHTKGHGDRFIPAGAGNTH